MAPKKKNNKKKTKKVTSKSIPDSDDSSDSDGSRPSRPTTTKATAKKNSGSEDDVPPLLSEEDSDGSDEPPSKTSRNNSRAPPQNNPKKQSNKNNNPSAKAPADDDDMPELISNSDSSSDEDKPAPKKKPTATKPTTAKPSPLQPPKTTQKQGDGSDFKSGFLNNPSSKQTSAPPPANSNNNNKEKDDAWLLHVEDRNGREVAKFPAKRNTSLSSFLETIRSKHGNGVGQDKGLVFFRKGDNSHHPLQPSDTVESVQVSAKKATAVFWDAEITLEIVVPEELGLTSSLRKPVNSLSILQLLFDELCKQLKLAESSVTFSFAENGELSHIKTSSPINLNLKQQQKLYMRLRKPLRFKVNDQIVCKSSSKWVQAKILERLCLNTKTRLRDIAYRCEERMSGNLVVIEKDSDDFIVKELKAKDSMERVQHAIILEMNQSRITEYTKSFPNFNKEQLISELLLYCFRNNNSEAVAWLVNKRNAPKVDLTSKLDSDGHSLAHICILNNRIDFLYDVERLLTPNGFNKNTKQYDITSKDYYDDFEQLILTKDNNGMNSLHYAVSYGHVEFFTRRIPRNFTEKRLKLRKEVDKSNKSPYKMMSEEQKYVILKYNTQCKSLIRAVNRLKKAYGIWREEREFRNKWKTVALDENRIIFYSFEDEKDKLEFVSNEEEDNEINDLVRLASSEISMREFGDDKVDDSEIVNMDSSNSSSNNNQSSFVIREEIVYTIEIAKSAEKWRSKSDKASKEIFNRCIERLSAGRESYSTMKRLKGVTYPIYEMKLTKGVRIIYTIIRRGEEQPSILIWYVCGHKFISDKAEAASEKAEAVDKSLAKLESIPVISGEEHSILQLGDDAVLLDPSGYTPLRIFSTNERELNDNHHISNWRPNLRLSCNQRKVSEDKDNVMVVGRSGTGKTVCLCDRMIKDREKFQCSQLFIARSERLKAFVEMYQLKRINNNVNSKLGMTDFFTLEDYIARMKQDAGELPRQFPNSKHVAYVYFRDIIIPEIESATSFKKKFKEDSSMVWIQIRSFIKGSTQTYKYWCRDNINVDNQSRSFYIPKELYMDNSLFSESRCRLDETTRANIYDNYFLKYQKILDSESRWDDADKVMHILRKLERNIVNQDGQTTNYRKDRIYVDEVQDSTQAEIILFMHANNFTYNQIFLAGDPAQAVEEGVIFRFEEVRGIVYCLENGKMDKIMIQKEVQLDLNFRSHAGIVNCAKSVLDKMINFFPNSASRIDEEGLAKGHVPLFYQAPSKEAVTALLEKNNKYMVLCQHEQREKIKDGYPETLTKTNFLSITEAKGMEYEQVIILDFFKHIPDSDQQHWAEMFNQNYDDMEPNQRAILKKLNGQIETQLKMLYTAITRCRSRLLFIEIVKSDEKLSTSWSSFQRWLVRKSFAEKYIVTEENDLMTKKEWQARGVGFYLDSKVFTFSDNLELFETFLSKAVECFRKTEECFAELEKCEIFRESVHFINKMKFEPDKGIEESKIHQVLESCVSSGLLHEACNVVKQVMQSFQENSNYFNKSFNINLFEKIVVNNLTTSLENQKKKQSQRDGDSL